MARLAILYGGYLAMKEEGTSITDVREQASGALSGLSAHGSSTPPAPTPAPAGEAPMPPLSSPAPIHRPDPPGDMTPEQQFDRRKQTVGLRGARRPVECLAVIDREEVLHVARLARLALSEEEVEPMARELSAVLDHIAKISQLDLDDVPPTSHVVEITGRLRPDEPRPCLPREVALEQAPAVLDDGFLVPSPQA